MSRRPRRPFTTTERSTILRMRLQGCTHVVISRALDRAESAIDVFVHRLRREGYDVGGMRKRPIDPAEVALVGDMAAHGVPHKLIARHLGLTVNQVETRAQRARRMEVRT